MTGFTGKFCIILLLQYGALSFAQVGIGTTTPSEKAMLEISSQVDGTGDYRGFLPPRVPSNTQRDAINPGAEDKGLIVYVNDSKCIELWNGAAWVSVKCGEDLPYASDLFISEYVEGSGNNKAIEIANFTGTTKDLNNYQLYLNMNGGTSSNTITFPASASIAHGSVFVVVHSSASLDLKTYANQQSGNLLFNGDDGVMLRNSSGTIIIDILGHPTSQQGFGSEITLRRKPYFGPSKIYVPEQYDMYPQNTFNGLGKHNYYE